MTQRRPGPAYDRGTPFYCPWCGKAFFDACGYDHSYEHQDVAPYAHLVIEEYWPVGLAAHAHAEGVVA